MRIWIVNPFEEFPINGTTPLRYGTLCRILAERGHQVIWWSSNFSHLTKTFRPVPLENESFAYRLISTPAYKRHVGLARWRNHRSFAKGFFRLARGAIENREIGKPDLILLSLPPLGIAGEAFRIRKLFGCRVVIDIVDSWPETFLRLIPGGDTVGRVLIRPLFAEAARAYRGADGITAVARTFLELPRNTGSKAPTHLTYLGGELASSVPEAEPRTPDPESSIKDLPTRFVYIGAMARSYDLETVLEAAKKLKDEGWQFELHLAGAGPKEERLREFAENHRLKECVVFHGYLGSEELKKLLAGSDVALNPIFDESCIAFPYKMSEYMSSGLAVINSLSGEVKEILDVNEAGEWYPAGDAATLVEKMKLYCIDPGRARRQGGNAHLFAEQELNRSKTYPKLAEFLESIAERGQTSEK